MTGWRVPENAPEGPSRDPWPRPGIPGPGGATGRLASACGRWRPGGAEPFMVTQGHKASDVPMVMIR